MFIENSADQSNIHQFVEVMFIHKYWTTRFIALLDQTEEPEPRRCRCSRYS